MHPISRTVIAMLAAGLCSLACGAEFGYANPFREPDAQKNFKQCFPKVTAEELARLAKISWYGYGDFGPPVVCPPEVGSDCKPGTTFFSSNRIIRFDTGMSQALFNATLNAQEGGDCSYNRMRNRSFGVSPNIVVAKFQVFHQERKCALGAKVDIGDGSADITLTVTLHPDFSVSNSHAKSGVRSSYLGFIDGKFLNNLGVQVLAFPVAGMLPLVMKDVIKTDAFSGLPNDLNFGGTGVDLYSYDALHDSLDGVGEVRAQTDYVIDRAASGFIEDKNSANLYVETFQRAFVEQGFRDSFINVRHTEIDFLRDINAIQPSFYTVVKGERLWDIAARRYRDPRLYTFLARKNGLHPPYALMNGQTIRLPRWQELCEDLNGNKLAVRKGDSLWLKAKRGEIEGDLSQIKTLSGVKRLIYPLEVLEVRPAAEKRPPQ